MIMAIIVYVSRTVRPHDDPKKKAEKIIITGQKEKPVWTCSDATRKPLHAVCPHIKLFHLDIKYINLVCTIQGAFTYYRDHMHRKYASMICIFVSVCVFVNRHVRVVGSVCFASIILFFFILFWNRYARSTWWPISRNNMRYLQRNNSVQFRKMLSTE